MLSRRHYRWLVLGLLGLAACTQTTATGTPPPETTAWTSTPEMGATFTPTLLPTAIPQISPTAISSPVPVDTPMPVVYVVQAGDTLLGVALDQGVPMAAIQLANEMGSSTVVQVGQELVIPPTTGWEGATAFWALHRVEAGETLYGIAEAYGIDPARLQSVNGLGDADLVTVGQDLILPMAAPGSTPELTEVPVVVEATMTPVPLLTELPSPTSVPVPVPATAVAPPSDVIDWPRETVRLINEVRASYNLPPLVYNEKLALAAQGQANDCSQRGWCSHTGSDGSDIKARILRVGYDPSNWAECWAQRQSPQDAVNVWMNETPPDDPHRRTLLSTWLTEIGIGVAPTTWGYYFLADFGKPRS